jgi:N-acyl homoserine lactone hydrolase
MGALGYGVPQSALNDPKGWSTLPKLIVYHLDKTISGQLAEIGLKTSDITYVVLSHTHGDHIGNVGLFPDSRIVMQRVEHSWIYSPDEENDNVNQLKALARNLMRRARPFPSVNEARDIKDKRPLADNDGHPEGLSATAPTTLPSVNG